jgi:hypothetical protein
MSSFVRRFGAFAGSAAQAGVGTYLGLQGNARANATTASNNKLTDARTNDIFSKANALKGGVPIVKKWLQNMGVKGVDSIDFGESVTEPTPSFTGAAAGGDMSSALETPPTPMVTNMARPRQLAFTPQVMQEQDGY